MPEVSPELQFICVRISNTFSPAISIATNGGCISGSSTGTFGAPEGTRDQPRNLLLIFSRFDEFSDFMWGVKIPADIVDSNKLKTVLDTTSRIQVGKCYGDMSLGNARQLEMPAVKPPGDHLSIDTIGAALDWFGIALEHDSQLESSQQVWYWKEPGTLIALIGLTLLIFPAVDLLISLHIFKSIKKEAMLVSNPSELRLNIALTMIIPVLTFFPLQTAADLVFPASAIFPQQITNGVLLWAWGTGLLTIGLFLFWKINSGKNLTELGMPLLNIVAFQFVPLMFLVGAVSTICFQKSGNIYIGTFINGIFVTWYMVAGTATQALPFWYY